MEFPTVQYKSFSSPIQSKNNGFLQSKNIFGLVHWKYAPNWTD
ncbi:MAG: hypothetical protein RIS29_706, partial [Bacteroidota bacterium]